MLFLPRRICKNFILNSQRYSSGVTVFTNLPSIHGTLNPDLLIYGDQGQRLQEGTQQWQMRLFNCISVPLRRHLFYHFSCDYVCSVGEIPCFMPHSFAQSYCQRKMSDLNLICKSNAFPGNGKFFRDSFSATYCSISNYCSDYHGETDGERDVQDEKFQTAATVIRDDIDSIESSESGDEIDNQSEFGEKSKSESYLKEVKRTCEVIENLLSSDHNMESVLDQVQIDLSHSLVLDVLSRFRHARKPAFRFFSWAGQRPGFSHNSQTYNSMMNILGKTRQFESMMGMLEEMGRKHVLTLETFIIAIKAFAAAREMKKAVAIFDLMRKYEFDVNTDMFNCLLDGLAKSKLGKEAQSLFHRLKGQFTPDLRTYTVLLSGWCKVKNLMEAGNIWNQMIDNGLKPDLVAHNIMLEGLFLGHRRSEAMKLFELMKSKGPIPNVRSYTILIRDLCKGNRMEEAVEMFDEMLTAGCQPDSMVYTCLIVGFGNQKRMDKVYGLLKEMKEKGCTPDGRTYNALIKLMTNRNMPDDAVRIYKKMVSDGLEPTVHTYNMIMKSYFFSKNYEMGCSVWDEMSRKGFCPDANSYTVFIQGLIRNGRSEKACMYIEEMINKGMGAPQLDYNKFAADFSRVGNPDILSEMARKMNFSGKFEDSNVFARWSDRMKKRVKKRDPERIKRRLF